MLSIGSKCSGVRLKRRAEGRDARRRLRAQVAAGDNQGEQKQKNHLHQSGNLICGSGHKPPAAGSEWPAEDGDQHKPADADRRPRLLHRPIFPPIERRGKQGQSRQFDLHQEAAAGDEPKRTRNAGDESKLKKMRNFSGGKSVSRVGGGSGASAQIPNV
ncbi:MAG TPA: hypothetical protein VFB27_00030 [Opitutaceae bacterium]|nr:hypothetical protein [Opitutaceae bacterium]